jgi:hypothetical protein
MLSLRHTHEWKQGFSCGRALSNDIADFAESHRLSNPVQTGGRASYDTLPLFQNKVVAILNEHLLSIRLRAQGCAMLDATWLATRARMLVPAGQPLGPIPSWRKQITERDIDPAPPSLLLDCES